MKEEELFTTYFLKVDEVVNTIRGLGERIDKSMILQHVLRSLHLKFDARVSTLE